MSNLFCFFLVQISICFLLKKLGPNREQRKQAILNSIPHSAFFTLLGSYDDAVTSAACKVLEKLLRSMSYADLDSLGLKVFLLYNVYSN